MLELEKHLPRPTWVEIDLDAIAHNLREIRRAVGDNIKIIACLKGNAYGHGILPVARTAFASGADIAAVGNIVEAILLRNHGIQEPILVFGNTLPSKAETYVKYGLIPTLFNWGDPELFARMGTRPIDVFVKVDTGLGRLGIPPQETIPYIEEILRYPTLRLTGIYTHFGTAAGEKEKREFVEQQFRAFVNILRELGARGICIPIQQAANSAAMVDMPHSWLTAVCPGQAIYGILSIESSKGRLNLRRAMTGLKSRLISVRRFPRGSNISGFSTQRDSVIGVAPVGFANGYPSVLGGRGSVLVREQSLPVVGSVSMEHIKIDLTDIGWAEVGDEVVLMGQQGDKAIWWEEMSKVTGIQIVELLTSLNTSISRVYRLEGRPSIVGLCDGEWSVS